MFKFTYAITFVLSGSNIFVMLVSLGLTRETLLFFNIRCLVYDKRVQNEKEKRGETKIMYASEIDMDNKILKTRNITRKHM